MFLKVFAILWASGLLSSTARFVTAEGIFSSTNVTIEAATGEYNSEEWGYVCPDCEDLAPDSNLGDKLLDYFRLNYYNKFFLRGMELFIKNNLQRTFQDILKKGYCCHLSAFVKAVEEHLCYHHNSNKFCYQCSAPSDEIAEPTALSEMAGSEMNAMLVTAAYGVPGTEEGSSGRKLKGDGERKLQNKPLGGNSTSTFLQDFEPFPFEVLEKSFDFQADEASDSDVDDDLAGTDVTAAGPDIFSGDIDLAFYKKCLLFHRPIYFYRYKVHKKCALALYIHKALDACICKYSEYDECTIERDCTETLKFNVEYYSRRIGASYDVFDGSVYGPCNGCIQSKFPCAGYCNYVDDYDGCDVGAKRGILYQYYRHLYLYSEKL